MNTTNENIGLLPVFRRLKGKDGKTSPVETADLAATDSPYRIEIISSRETLLALRTDWNQLVAETGINHPFISHEWIYTWWECFGGTDSELYVVLVRAGEKIRAILPLALDRVQMYGIPTRRLRSLCNMHTPRFELIAVPGDEDAHRCVWHHLRAVAGKWDMLILSNLPSDCRTLHSLPKLVESDGYRTGVWPGESSPYVLLRGSWSDYFHKLSRNHRARVRKRLNKLEQLGKVGFEEISAPEAVAAALNDGFRIESAAWKKNSGTAILSQPEIERFYRLFAEQAANMGILRLLFLTLNGSRIAFSYALYRQQRLYVLKSGYDPAFAQYSPSHLLCYFAIQGGFDHGMEEYDFLGNSEPWKIDWAREIHAHSWLFIFSRGVRAKLLYKLKFHWIPLLQQLRKRFSK